MPEAEDVITDAARHATVFARALWKRHRRREERPVLALSEVAARLDLLIVAVFGLSARLRIAQPPARATFLTHIFNRKVAPPNLRAVPATDGSSIWLPRDAGDRDGVSGIRYFRCMALTQAARAQRGAAATALATDDPLVRSVYLLLEAQTVDRELARSMPGLASEFAAQRAEALAARPPLSAFAPQRLALERFARRVMTPEEVENVSALADATPSPASVLQRAAEIAASLERAAPNTNWAQGGKLYLDEWTGDLRPPSQTLYVNEGAQAQDDPEPSLKRPPRSARLARRPEVRQAKEGEDDARPGAWMIQTSQPHEHAEDPLGMQRPSDQDQEAAAEEHADSVSELAQARLVRSPGSASEVLLSEDELDASLSRRARVGAPAAAGLVYPEWDYRTESYREPGACVRLLPAELGSPGWVSKTLSEHAAMIATIRRRFQVLRARRTVLRAQEDGDELDLEAYIEMQANLRAERPARQAIYQSQRAARRDTAILLLVDVSGSTDGWVVAQRRVIDVEKEALLLVCCALAETKDPFSVLAFSGESARAVTMRTVKSFEERYSQNVALRIAALEPESYTRAGAALRHASTLLMQQTARHRLLLLLSDGKPNDVDEYEGQYGIADMQRAVIEAKLQGIHPFCLTVDRQAASYLPRIFGPGHYALLPRPELLPTALLAWLKHFIVR
jgi:nitric oxide reductase NorD protein